MNYEEAFRHYREGTATEEEKAFVQDEIAKAKALSSLLDDEALAVKPAPIKEADAKEVKKAKNQITHKSVMAGVIAVIVLLVVLGAVLGGVFGAAAGYAKINIQVSEADAIAYAQDYAASDAATRFGYTGTAENFNITDNVEKKFNIESDLTRSYYSYEIELKAYDTTGFEYEYKILVNSKTGSCSVLEVERDRD